MNRLFLRAALSFLALSLAGDALCKDNDRGPVLPKLATSDLLVASTIPANGDVNPYGVTFVPDDFTAGGKLHSGDVLISNFNASSNLQGTGTTIVSVSPGGKQSVFFQGKPGIGLSTALGVLRRGVVLVGNVPTTDGTFATVQAGSLIAIDRWGKQIAEFSDSTLLDGPWDLEVVDRGSEAIVFVSNALNGTVARLEFDVAEDGESIFLENLDIVAEGYEHRGDPAALVIGPTGLAFDKTHDVLFVASTGDNAVYAIYKAMTRTEPVLRGHILYRDTKHLRGPLGLALAPNGHLIATNGDAINGDPKYPSEMVEFTVTGHFVAQYSVDLGGQGGAFGIAILGSEEEFRVAAVDDITNTVKIWEVEE